MKQQHGNMQLRIDLDSTYLVMPGTKSHFAGYFYLASHPHPLNYNRTPHNDPFFWSAMHSKMLSALQQRQSVGASSIAHNLQL
eukprot:15338244-Ditylum_brightwellii.AAC.1